MSKFLPPGWPEKRLRFVVTINPLPPPRQVLHDDADVSFLPMEAIGEDGSLRLDACRQVADVRAGYSYFADGDVAFAKVTPCFENGKGALMRGLAGGHGFGTTELTVLRPGPALDARFLHYFLQSPRFRQPGAGAMTGAGGLKRVPEEFTRNIPIPLPGLQVQRSVADFLDRETARIDALIEKKTCFIELLREKRQALITQAVTRGFDSATPLEASGVEWLPPIPAHWSVTRLQFVIKAFEQGWSPECYAYPAGAGEWGVVKAGCVNRGIFDPEQNKRLPEEHVPREDIEIRPGDVLMSRASGSVELIGSVARATATDARLMLSDKTFRLALQPEWDADFFIYTMQSSAARDQILVAISGAEGLANNLAQASIKEFIVVQPPRSEQEQIAAETTARLSRLDKIAALTESSLHLLRERRAALITAAVTGQINVRAAA